MAHFNTIFPADTVEFCPFFERIDILACGTYKLVTSDTNSKEPQISESELELDLETKNTDSTRSSPQRIGKLIFLGLAKDSCEIQRLDEVELPAILDTKWSHALWDEKPLIAAADAEGCVSLLKYDIEKQKAILVQSISCGSSSSLCLSLDWSNRRSSNDPGSIVVSLSDGILGVLKPNDNSGMVLSESWHAHDFEPWAVGWNYWSTNLIYSGGDDLTLKGWDVRQSFSMPIFANKRFNAGITSIQNHPFVENLIAVGSYDNLVRIFDARNMFRPVKEVEVGGGAWRVKWHPNEKRKSDILVACMHDGFKILRFASDLISTETLSAVGDVDCDVIKRYDHHKSLAYGVDWSHVEEIEPNSTTIASCSFYDHALHIWKG